LFMGKPYTRLFGSELLRTPPLPRLCRRERTFFSPPSAFDVVIIPRRLIGVHVLFSFSQVVGDAFIFKKVSVPSPPFSSLFRDFSTRGRAGD